MEGVTIIEMIVDCFFVLVDYLKQAVPLCVFGFEITWWQLIISLFICGSVINILVGSDEDLE